MADYSLLACFVVERGSGLVLDSDPSSSAGWIRCISQARHLTLTPSTYHTRIQITAGPIWTKSTTPIARIIRKQISLAWKITSRVIFPTWSHQLNKFSNSFLICYTIRILCCCFFFRLFGIPGVCASCNKSIAAFEFVMRAGQNAYHIECFSCQICRQRFRVGENFHFYNNKVLCWDHYRLEKEEDKTNENSTI